MFHFDQTDTLRQSVCNYIYYGIIQIATREHPWDKISPTEVDMRYMYWES